MGQPGIAVRGLGQRPQLAAPVGQTTEDAISRASAPILALLLGTAGTACSSVLAYPDMETEVCTGGVDEDLDDLVDCDDHIDCDGQCAERTEVTIATA
jgi:hypothetical protein